MIAQSVFFVSNADAQTGLLFDGDFESGTFQGWTPGGINGGFASLAAKGSCFSGNDTTAISFNGNPTSNYAALLRSNPNGDTDSIATLRSQPFIAGNGVIFSALTETLSADPGDQPVDFIVNIIDSTGAVISEQPYRTAIVQLAEGCPSEPRDTAFSGHFIDTHQLVGQEIAIEFTQNTRGEGLGYFTLIDNVVFIDESSFLLSTSQPRAVAGTGITTSGTFFLDPRSSTDPDDAPFDLSYSWFINGETSIRELDIPCVNLNSDVQLDAGNNIATLYVNDGFSYSADTIRFVIPEESSGTTATATDTTDDTGTDTDTDTDTGTDTTDGTDTDTDTDTATGPTLTDPLNECDVDLTADFLDPPTDDDGTDGTDGDATDGGDGVGDPTNDGGTVEPSISVTGGASFTIGGNAVNPSSNATITQSSLGASIISATVSVQNPQDGDSLSLDNPPTGLDVSGQQSATLLIRLEAGAQVTDETFENAIESITYSYEVPAGATPVTTARTISYTVNDGNDVSGIQTTLVTIIP